MPFPRSVRLFTYGKEVGGACFRTGCSVCPYAGAEPGPHSTCWTYASASLLESDCWRASRRYRAPVAYVHGQAEILESA